MPTLSQIITQFITYMRTNNLTHEDVILTVTFTNNDIIRFEFEDNTGATLQIYGQNCNVETVAPMLSQYADDENLLREVPVTALTKAITTPVNTHKITRS